MKQCLQALWPILQNLNQDFEAKHPELVKAYQNQDPEAVRSYEESFSRVVDARGLYCDYLAYTAFSRLSEEGYQLSKPAPVTKIGFREDRFKCLGQLEELEFLRVYGRWRSEGIDLVPQIVQMESRIRFQSIRDHLIVSFEGGFAPSFRSESIASDYERNFSPKDFSKAKPYVLPVPEFGLMN